MERAETLDEIKKTVADIEILKEAVEEINDKMDGDEIMKSISARFKEVDLERNTKVLLKESYERFIEDAKKLLENEIGERMKKLNIHS